MSLKINTGNECDAVEGDKIRDELQGIKEGKFKFGCLGINCLGWIIIAAIIVVIYLIKNK